MLKPVALRPLSLLDPSCPEMLRFLHNWQGAKGGSLEVDIQRRRYRKRCNKWCMKHHQRLPREIRDMIYDYLLPLKPVKTISSWIQSRREPQPVLFGSYAHVDGDYYQYLDDKIVGKAFIMELMFIIYKKTRWRLISPDHISYFLDRTTLEDIGLPWVYVRPWALIQYLRVILPYRRHLEAMKLLDGLRNFEYEKVVQLELKFDWVDPPGLQELLEAIKSWVSQMRARGFEFKMTAPLYYRQSTDFVVCSYRFPWDFENWKMAWSGIVRRMIDGDQERKVSLRGSRDFVLAIGMDPSMEHTRSAHQTAACT